jgi:hypothetical protein
MRSIRWLNPGFEVSLATEISPPNQWEALAVKEQAQDIRKSAKNRRRFSIAEANEVLALSM